jgi:flagellar assembly protein FliH
VAKHVFKPTEIINLSRRVFIEPPQAAEEVEELETLAPEEEYEGPTVDDIRKEAEEFRAAWETEKEEMVAQARAEAEKIVKDAEQVAFGEVKNKNNQAKKIRQEAEDEAKRIVNEAEKTAQEMQATAESRVAQLEKEAYEKGYAEGREKGYASGQEEIDRLIQRFHVIIAKAIEKRNEIIDDSENQLIDMVLLIARKVIKVISENQRNVVINNVIQSLRKLKSRGDVVVRVNLEDLQLATEHAREFVEKIENVKTVTVMEDSTVDRGGCLIETDFGQIDARISSQLHEIEEKILDMMPIRTKGG